MTQEAQQSIQHMTPGPVTQGRTPKNSPQKQTNKKNHLDGDEAWKIIRRGSSTRNRCCGLKQCKFLHSRPSRK